MPKILIVDDDRTTVRLLQTLLQLDGFDVLIASRGQDALTTAFEQKPDVFLVDFHLMDMDAIELITALRAAPEFANAPIVVASGMDKEEEVLRVEASRFLGKPFDPNSLATIFYDLLG